MRYEKGDKVKIANTPNERMTNGMYKYCGWRVTIASSRKYVGSGDIVYHLKEDDGKYAWFEDDFQEDKK